MTKEVNEKKLNKALSVQVLLESMLYSHICENYELMKTANPILANLCRKDLQTIHRNHEFYASKFRELLSPELLSDYEELRNIIEGFVNERTTDNI